MDAISVLDTTACILAVTEFISELLSSLNTSKAQPPLSLDRKDEPTISHTLERLRTTLFDIRIPPIPQQPSASVVTPSEDALALRELLSSQQASTRLLGDVMSTFKSPGQPWRSRISELSRVVESSESEKQYIRSEFESRIDSVARDLEDLRFQVRTRLANPRASTPTVLTETDAKELKTRLVSPTNSENALLADKIVSSLNHDSRPARLDSVPQAHKDTFQWAFDPQLSKWFRSGSGTFWISALRSPSGTPVRCLSHEPQTLGSCQGRTMADGRRAMVVPELATALRALVTADHVPLKICFFMDGLDEYDSNHDELCKVLRDTASSPHIKMRLSSRRWPVFERSFGGSGQKSLDNHDLIRDDIRKFVNDQLQAHERWTTEVSLEKTELMDWIVAQADGVFL